MTKRTGPPAAGASRTCPRAGTGVRCQHQPPCPPPAAPDREAAAVVAPHPEQGWSLLCNGVVLFEDTGLLLPDGQMIPPHPQPATARPRHTS